MRTSDLFRAALVCAAIGSMACSTPSPTGEATAALGGEDDTICHLGTPYCPVLDDCATAADCCAAEHHDMCGKGCVDLQNDPHNCGKCGFSCGDDICQKGECAHVEFGSTELFLGGPDLRVSTSSKFVLASNGAWFNLLNKAVLVFNGADQAQVNDTELTGGLEPTTEKCFIGECHRGGAFCDVSTFTCTEMLTGGQSLFKDLLFTDGPENLNNLFIRPRVPIVPCDLAQPFPWAVDPPPGIEMTKNKDGVPATWPSSSCLNDVYDMQQTYDVVRHRFWVVAHLRNAIATNSCDVGASKDKDTCEMLNSLAMRITLVAVSKDEDPHHGFWKYVVAEDYADMPWEAIHNDYAMFFHNADGSVHLFDADQLANGQQPLFAKEITALQPGTLDGGQKRVAKHHEGAGNMTYIVSTDPSGGDEMWIYGLESPHGGAPTLFGPARYRDPLVDEMIVQDVAYADGALYVAAGSMLADGDGVNISGVSGGEIYVRRLPVTATTVKNRENIDPYSAGLWTLSSPGEVLDIPGIDVNDRGDVIVGYRAYDPNGKNVSTARYQLLYAGDYAFRKPELTLAPDPDWTGRGRDGLDYQTAVRDGVDPTAFWLGLRSFNDDKDGDPYDRMVLTYVRP